MPTGFAGQSTILPGALQTLDFLVSAAVEEGPRNDPPPAPAIGSCYVVGSAPTGAWAGKPQSVAGCTSGGWRFISPIDGMSAYVKSDNQWANYRSGAWETGMLRGASVLIGGVQVVGNQAAPIASPTGGSTVDSEGRATIDAILAALRAHGLIHT
jgi:hypothetical protein